MSRISRRKFIKMSSAGAMALPFRRFAGGRQPRLNVIFIFVDDMGYGDLSNYGNCELETPNIDRIADEGIKFTNFYCTSPICSPSRVAVTTGQYPARWRINSFLATRERNRKRDMADFLDPEAPSLARTFKNAGYKTAHFGKWHMGGGRDVDDAPLPQAYGFDESLVSFEGLGDRILQKGQPLSEANAKLGRGNIEWVEKWEMSGIYADRTIDFIKRNKDQPFYIHLWPGDVHDPHLPRPEWKEKFKTFAKDKYKRDFYAVLWNMDRQIGRVLDTFDEHNLTENTLVVLTSDNGPTDWPRYYNEHYWPPGDTGPFKGRKWSLYEGGIRMPFMARWPGTIPAGSSNTSSIMHSVDLFPTFCSLANVSTPGVTFDGINMASALKGKAQQREAPVFWEYGRSNFYLQPGNPRFRSPNLAVRDGQWKLLLNDNGSKKELYNLEKDKAEAENLVVKHPETAERLAGEVLEWRQTLP